MIRMSGELSRVGTASLQSGLCAWQGISTGHRFAGIFSGSAHAGEARQQGVADSSRKFLRNLLELNNLMR